MKTFTFIKQIFFSTLMYFASLSIVNPLECISMNNQECKVRPEIVNNNSNNPMYYPFGIVSVYADYIKLFVITNNAGIKINTDANIKN